MLKLMDGFCGSKWGTIALNVVSGLALLVAATWFSFNLFNVKQEAEVAPRKIADLWLEPSTITAGGTFTTHSKVDIIRACPFDIHWALARASDNMEVVRVIDPTRPAQTTLVGLHDQTVITRHTIPIMAPGIYHYTAVVYDICPNRTYVSVVSVKHSVDLTVQ